MLEVRIHLDPSRTQALTSTILAISALASIIASPIIGHYADRVSSRKIPLLAGLCLELTATVGVSTAKTREQCAPECSRRFYVTLMDFMFSASFLPG